MGVIDSPCLSLIDVDLASTTPQPMVTDEVLDILMGNFSSTNDSVICSTALPDTAKQSLEESLNALMYIVVVLLFYAFSLVVLMVKYIRRENKEAYLRQCFQEFVAREQFQSAQIRNQIHMQHVIRQTDLQQLQHCSSHEPRTQHHSPELSCMESITEQPSGQLAVLVQETPV